MTRRELLALSALTALGLRHSCLWCVLSGAGTAEYSSRGYWVLYRTGRDAPTFVNTITGETLLVTSPFFEIDPAHP